MTSGLFWIHPHHPAAHEWSSGCLTTQAQRTISHIVPGAQAREVRDINGAINPLNGGEGWMSIDGYFYWRRELLWYHNSMLVNWLHYFLVGCFVRNLSAIVEWYHCSCVLTRFRIAPSLNSFYPQFHLILTRTCLETQEITFI